MRYFIQMVCLIWLGGFSTYAATITSTTTGGNWNTGSTWIGGSVPNTGDNVVIQGNVILDGNITCRNLTLFDGMLTFNDSRSLTITQDLTFDGGTMTMAANTVLNLQGHWIDKDGSSSPNFDPGPVNIATLDPSLTSTVVLNGNSTQYINVTTPVAAASSVQDSHTLNFAFLTIDGSDVQFFSSYLQDVTVAYTFTVNTNKSFTLDYFNPNSTDVGVKSLHLHGDIQNNGTFIYAYTYLVAVAAIELKGNAPYQHAGNPTFFLHGSGVFHNLFIRVSSNVTYTIDSNITIKMLEIQGTVILDSSTLTISKTLAGTNCFMSLVQSSSNGTFIMQDNGTDPVLQIGSSSDVGLIGGRTDNAYLNVENGCTFTTAATSTIRFQGAVQQAIYNNANNAPLSFPYFVMNNSSATGVYLYGNDLNVTNNGTFMDGRLYTSESLKISFRESATSTITDGLNSDSYVVGWVEKKSIPLSSTFEFPLGNDDGVGNQFYAPIKFTATSNAHINDTYLATYRRISPSIGSIYDPAPNVAPYPHTTFASTLDHVSRAEYWMLEQTYGSSTVHGTVGMSYDNIRSLGETDPATLRVCHWKSSTPVWEDMGNSGWSGATSRGYINSTVGVFTSFSPITLGSTTPASINPLPVIIKAFSAEKRGNDTFLSWQIATDGEGYTYQIQRSLDGVHFEPVSILTQASARTQGFQYADTQAQFLHAPVVYYRILVTDEKQVDSYSQIQSVWYGAAYGIAAYPNPFDSQLTLAFTLPKASTVTIQIVDMLGREVYQQLVKGSEGWNQLSLTHDSLPAGTYFMQLNSPSQKYVQKLIKR